MTSLWSGGHPALWAAENASNHDSSEAAHRHSVRCILVATEGTETFLQLT